MCVYSAMGDHYSKKLPEMYPWIQPVIYPATPPLPNLQPAIPAVTREEFEALRKDVKEMKEILRIAKKYDDDTGQPDCETDEKIKLIKKIAKLVGVEL